MINTFFIWWFLPDLPDDFDHFESHFNTIMGVFCRQGWNSGHAVVTIAQDFNSQTVVFLCKFKENNLKSFYFI